MGTCSPQRVALLVVVHRHVSGIVLQVEGDPLLAVVAGLQFPAAGTAVAVGRGGESQGIGTDGRGLVEFVFVPRIEQSVVATLAIVVVYLLAVGIGNLSHSGRVVVYEVGSVTCLGSSRDGAVEAVGQILVVRLRIAKQLDVGDAKSRCARGFPKYNLKP